jgi:hypothetical protein
MARQDFASKLAISSDNVWLSSFVRLCGAQLQSDLTPFNYASHYQRNITVAFGFVLPV